MFVFLVLDVVIIVDKIRKIIKYKMLYLMRENCDLKVILLIFVVEEKFDVFVGGDVIFFWIIGSWMYKDYI